MGLASGSSEGPSPADREGGRRSAASARVGRAGSDVLQSVRVSESQSVMLYSLQVTAAVPCIGSITRLLARAPGHGQTRPQTQPLHPGCCARAKQPH
jgi:hypothetical protein